MMPGGYDRTRDGLAEGCCSAVSPCSHQRRDPTTICATCQQALGIETVGQDRDGPGAKPESPAPSGATPERSSVLPLSDEVAELRALSEAATPGPWSDHEGDVLDAAGFAHMDSACNLAINRPWQDANPDEHWGAHDESHREMAEGEGEANAAFIVALVNAYRSGRLIPAPAQTPVREVGAAEVLRVALEGIAGARARYGATGFPIDLYDDPAGWMEGRARSALDRYYALAAAPPASGARGMGKALDDIAAERRRQVEVEDWTPEHDDEYRLGEICDAAAAYALHAGREHRPRETPPGCWPWRREWWKPTDRRRDLVKAGALIAAEIDRLDRVSPPDAPGAGRSGL